MSATATVATWSLPVATQTRCERCGTTQREVQGSHAANAATCLSCYLREAPQTEGADRELLDLAAEIRRDADDLFQAAGEIGSRQLRAIAAKLDSIPLLLEVGSDRETPEELVADAGRLRAHARKLLGGRR